MSGSRRTAIRVEIIGDATSAQKAFRDTETSARQAESGLGGFGAGFTESFVKIGSAVAIGAAAAGLAIEAVRGAAEAVGEYRDRMQQSEATILGVTKSQDALNQAFAFANDEVRAGRSAYSATVAAIAELTPVAKRASLGVTDLYRTVQLLSTLNSGPTGGVEGAVVAINEALAGQYRSLQARFNLPVSGIEEAVGKGVPVLQAINDALAKEGVTMDLVNAKSKTFANQTAIAKDELAKLAEEAGEPIFDGLNEGLKTLNSLLTGSNPHIAGWREQFSGLIEVVRGADVGVAQFERAILRLYQAIPNSRGPDSDVSKWIQKSIDDLTAEIDRGGLAAKEASKKAADAAASGFAPTPAQIATVKGYGASALRAYLSGFDAQGLGIFDDLKKTLEDGLKAASPDGKVSDAALQGLLPALAQIADEIQRTGTVSAATWAGVASALGGEAPLVRQLIGDYEALAAAKRQAAQAGQALASAEATLAEDRAAAAGEAASYADQIKTAQANQAAADKAEEANIKGLTSAHKALGDEARKAASDGAAALVPLNDQLRAAQANAAAAAAGYQAQNDAIQRQIDLNNEVVSQLEHQRDVKFLAIDERLAELRGSKNKDDRREAAELRRERARIERDTKPQIDLERERAQVANFGLQEQQKAIQAAAKAEAERNAASIAGIQAAITKQQELNTATAAGYQKRLDDQQAEIDKITEAHQTRHDDDQDRITQLQTIADKSATYWAGRIASDQAAVDAAKQLADYYKAQETASANTLANIQKQIAALAAAGLLTTTVPTVPGQRPGTQGDDNGQNDGPSGPAGAQGGGRDARGTTADVSGAPNGSRVFPADYAGPGPNPTLYLGKDGQLHPYAPGSAGGYQIPDANSLTRGGASTQYHQHDHTWNMYGVGEAALLDRIRQTIEGIAAT
jgi:hypothetical protein